VRVPATLPIAIADPAGLVHGIFLRDIVERAVVASSDGVNERKAGMGG
jgi:hypothetical protein